MWFFTVARSALISDGQAPPAPKELSAKDNHFPHLARRLALAISTASAVNHP